jgi:hypothetical protein
MTSLRGKTAAAAVAVMVVTLAPVGSAQARGSPPSANEATAADTSPPRVRGIWFSRNSVAVSGLAVVPVTLSVRLTDPSGVSDRPVGLDATPQLTVAPVPGFAARLNPVLARTSGTVTDGVWSATIHVPSTWNGIVRVTSVGAVDLVGNELRAALSGVESPALRVVGTHRPALTFHYVLLSGGGFGIHGRAYFTDTGRPIAWLPLATAYDSNCDFDGGGVNDIVTDARGRYQKRWPNGDPAAAGCVALIGPAAPGQRPPLLVYHVASAPQPAIPDAAMLQPEDLRGAFVSAVDGDTWSQLRPPQPCADRSYPSDGLRRDDRAVMAVVGIDERPTVVVEHVATYRANGAHRYLRDLRRALAVCGGIDEEGGRWTVLATGVAGDESLLLRHRTYLDYADMYHNTYLTVARIGRVLVVVADAGWETGSGHEPLVRELSTIAVWRAAVLNQR